MVEHEQLQAVAAMCNGYSPKSDGLNTENFFDVSCETCTHWQGVCVIDKFDRILFGVEQR